MINMKLTVFQYKIIAEAILLFPVGLLLLLGLGEMLGGDKSAIQHFIELVPFVVLASISWYYPKIGGAILAIIAAILAILYFLFFTHFTLPMRIINDAILFLPPIIAGILFFTADIEHKTG